jgi:hypothetical protein
MATVTTNIHFSGSRKEMAAANWSRVKLTGDTMSGECTWAEVYDPAGNLRGCGPSLVGVPSSALAEAENRISLLTEHGSLFWFSRGLAVAV